MPYVREGLDLVPYGWLDSLRGRYVDWFGEGLHSIPWLPTWQSDGQSTDQFYAVRLWERWVCPVGPETVEVLKGLSMLGKLYTSSLLSDWLE